MTVLGHVLWGALALVISVGSTGSAQADTTSSEMTGLAEEETIHSFELKRPEAAPGQDPTQGAYEQALGFYSKGRLTAALNFPLEGPGFVKIFRARDRGWGTFDLIRVVELVSERLSEEFPNGERVQIGDVSDQDGGRLSRHASHQNGLDADLAFLRKDNREQNPEEFGGFDESFVIGDRVSQNFDLDRNYRLVKLLVETGRINRIFVDRVIKHTFCEHAKKRGEYLQVEEYLRRLRPWPYHDDHLHVRITCPGNSSRCQSQQEPPPGSGCDEARYELFR